MEWAEKGTTHHTVMGMVPGPPDSVKSPPYTDLLLRIKKKNQLLNTASMHFLHKEQPTSGVPGQHQDCLQSVVKLG